MGATRGARSNSRKVLRWVLYLGFAMFLVFGGVLVYTKVITGRLPLEYSQSNFDETESQRQEFGRTAFDKYGCCILPSGRNLGSSLFPYITATTIAIDSRNCPRRYINVDPLWNVFWVEVAQCGEKTKFYGPYRTEIDARRSKTSCQFQLLCD